MEMICKWENCNQGNFTDVNILYSHITNEHIGRKTKGNLCLTCKWENCGVSTTKRDHITSHIRIHIPLRPYDCKKCGRPFKRTQDLKKHMKIHNEGRRAHPGKESKADFSSKAGSVRKNSGTDSPRADQTLSGYSQKRSRDQVDSLFSGTSPFSASQLTPIDSEQYGYSSLDTPYSLNNQSDYNLDSVINTLKKIRRQEDAVNTGLEELELLEAINTMMTSDPNNIQELPKSLQAKNDMLNLNQSFISIFPELSNSFDTPTKQINISTTQPDCNKYLNDVFFDQPNSEIVTTENGMLFEDLLNQIQSSDLFGNLPMFDTSSRSIDQTAIESPYSQDIGSILDNAKNGSAQSMQNTPPFSQAASTTKFTSNPSFNNTSNDNVNDTFSSQFSSDFAMSSPLGAHTSPISKYDASDVNGLYNRSSTSEAFSSDVIKDPEVPGSNVFTSSIFTVASDPEISNKNNASANTNVPQIQESFAEPSQHDHISLPTERIYSNIMKLLTEVGISLSTSQRSRMNDFLVKHLSQQAPNLRNPPPESSAYQNYHNSNDVFPKQRESLVTQYQYQQQHETQSQAHDVNISAHNNAPSIFNSGLESCAKPGEGISDLAGNNVLSEQQISSFLTEMDPFNAHTAPKTSQQANSATNYNTLVSLLQEQDMNLTTSPEVSYQNYLVQNNQMLFEALPTDSPVSTHNFDLGRAPESNDWSLDKIMKLDSPAVDFISISPQVSRPDQGNNDWSHAANTFTADHVHTQGTLDSFSKTDFGLVQDINIDNFNYVQPEDHLGAILNPSIVTTKLVGNTEALSKVGLFHSHQTQTPTDANNKNLMGPSSYNSAAKKAYVEDNSSESNDDYQHSEGDSDDYDSFSNSGDYSSDYSDTSDADALSKPANMERPLPYSREEIVRNAAKLLARINALYVSNKMGQGIKLATTEAEVHPKTNTSTKTNSVQEETDSKPENYVNEHSKPAISEPAIVSLAERFDKLRF